MDQDQFSDAIASPTTKKLNAKAPEFVPRSSSSSSSAAPPPPTPLLQPVYARPPAFAPPPYFAYENFFQQGVPPFYGYNVNPVPAVDFPPEGNNGSAAAAAASKKTGLPDAHQKIINQVEFYFSDINLATTDQLFRFMGKDPDGYVPLSVVASFKKIKTAITDCIQLANILRSSNKLLVSEDGKKVKREHPLTESDMEELQSRIIVAENLPEDHSHQNLMKIFSSVGSVKSIRTCPPQNSNAGSSSTSKSGRGDGPHSSGKFHAFVEYESVEVAEKAVAELNDEGNWRNCLKVRLLNKSVVRPTNPRAKKVGREGQHAGKRDEAVAPEMQGSKDNHLEDALRQSDAHNIEPQMESNAKSTAARKGRTSGGGKGRGKGQGRGRPPPPTHDGNIVGSPQCEVPLSTEKFNNNAAKASPVPRMPDGTRGFSMGRGKPVAVKIA